MTGNGHHHHINYRELNIGSASSRTTELLITDLNVMGYRCVT